MLFCVCAGLLLLAGAYCLGATSAGPSRKRIVTEELVVTDDTGSPSHPDWNHSRWRGSGSRRITFP